LASVLPTSTKSCRTFPVLTSLTTSTRHSTSTAVSAILRNQTWSAG